MQAATAWVTQPTKRKGRALAGARPSLKLHSNSGNTDSITALRRQRLAAFGLSNVRADLVAALEKCLAGRRKRREG